MRSNQLKALKKILARNKPHRSPSELDAKILKQAETEIEVRAKTNENSQPLIEYLLSPLSQVGNALGAISLTLICFLSMAKLTSIPEPDVEFTQFEHQTIVPSAKTIRNTSRRSSRHSSKHSSRHGSFVATRPAFGSKIERTFTVDFTADQLLMQLSLPNVAELVDSMEFVAESDRSAATIELISALADINFLIDHRKFDDARDRYFDLLANCYVCELPTSLEALAINNIQQQGSG